MEIDRDGVEIGALEAFGVFGGRSLLEVGCGDGRVTAQLAGRLGRLVALDPCAEDLVLAAGRVEGAMFCRASGEQLPFSKQHFDTILFSLSLHHQDSRRALQEALRVLRPGGCILVMEPTADGELQQFFHLFENESGALAAALAAIADSPLTCTQVTQIEIEWRFASRDEFNRYMFAYHHQAPDRLLAAAISGQLGSKAADRPLTLKDRIRLLRLAR